MEQQALNDFTNARIWPVTDYCREEVERQGHNTAELDGIERVAFMMDAWALALRLDTLYRKKDMPVTITKAHILEIGRRVEPSKNSIGFRRQAVWVGGHEGAPWMQIESLLEALLSVQDEMEPMQFYRELLTIHPFLDGNGRSGKVLLNWLNSTLLCPIFPPKDFWGRPCWNP